MADFMSFTSREAERYFSFECSVHVFTGEDQHRVIQRTTLPPYLDMETKTTKNDNFLQLLNM